jgi:hypothetical protein
MGSNISTVILRVIWGDENGSLKSETVKYGRESQGTQTRERLRWQGPAAYTKDRPVLSSESSPHKIQDHDCQTVINIWSWAPDGARHQDLLTDRPSVAMWLWLSLWPVEAASRKFSGSSWSEFTEEYSAVYLRLFKSFKWQLGEVRRVKTYCVNWRLYLKCFIQWDWMREDYYRESEKTGAWWL